MNIFASFLPLSMCYHEVFTVGDSENIRPALVSTLVREKETAQNSLNVCELV